MEQIGEKTERKKYWLKLDKDFLKSPQMKVIKNMSNGKDYIIFYLSLMLESVETVGHLRFTSLVPYNAEMLSSITDTNVDIVKNAIKIFCELGLMQIFDDGTIFMTEVPKITGKECESAERVRRFREKQNEIKMLEELKQPKTNAQRQRQFRAKKNCEQKQHIPYIEDYINNKRYNGNYYIVIQRDKYKCAICGSIENLCVHHIDGYDEKDFTKSNENKMITLCRNCHSNIHAGNKIDEDILNSIDYYEESNEMLPSNSDVTKCNVYIEEEKDKNKNKNKNKNIDIKESYGKYNRIKLKPEEYTKLVEDFGEDFIKTQIDLLDEYVESNNNKNKYTNFNLVLRKSIRENWFKNKKIENKTNNPFLDMVKEEYCGR